MVGDNGLGRIAQDAFDPWREADEALSLLLRLVRGGPAALFAVSDAKDMGLTLINSRQLDQRVLDVARHEWALVPDNVRNGSPLYSQLGEHLHLLLPCLAGGIVVGLVHIELDECSRRLPAGDLTTFAGILGRALKHLCARPGDGGKAETPDSNGQLETADADRENLILLLQRNEWNVSRAARLLGVTRMTVYNRMRRLDIPRQRMQRGKPPEMAS